MRAKSFYWGARAGWRRRIARVVCELMERRRLLSTVVVNTLLDETVANATTSLREAIAMAAAGDTIQFAGGLSGQIDLAGGNELVVAKNVAIVGGPQMISVSGVGAGRVFHVAAGANVSISGIKILNGRAELGGGVYVESGSLLLENVVLANNTAVGKNGDRGPNGSGSGDGGDARGGGIYNAAALDIKASTIGGNKAIGGAGVATATASGQGGAALGAGIFNSGDATCRISGSTLAGNNAVGGAGYFGTVGGNGGIARGGAIYATGGVVEISNSTLTGNAATGADGAKGHLGPGGIGGSAEGGAVYAHAGGVFVSTSDVSSNLAWGGEGGDSESMPGIGAGAGGAASGGGIYAAGETSDLGRSPRLEVTDSAIRGNTAHAGRTAKASGGGIFAGGYLTLTRSTIDANKASALSQFPELPSRSGGIATGGGLVAGGGEVFHSTISNNTAEGGAGGIGYHLGAFDHPAGDGGAARGGGIFDIGLLAITNSTVARNLSTGGRGGDFNFTTNIPAGDGGEATGGGIFVNFGAALDLKAVTVSLNRALGGSAGASNGPATAGANGAAAGGGIEHQGVTSLLNTIVAGNTALTGPDVHGAFTPHGFNLIGKTDGSSGWIASDQKGTIASPLDAKLGDLADNGGATKTMLPLPTSPAVDAGAHVSSTDQRGLPRPFDIPTKPNAAGSDGTDIGAVELQSTPYLGSALAVSAAGPATLQFENFDEGGEGVAYHDLDPANLGGTYRPATGVDIQPTSDTGGGFNVGWTRAGEWLNYTVDVVDGGVYNLDFRVASNGPGGKFHLELDGKDVTGQLTVPNTFGWQSWTSLSKTGVNLTAGRHVLRLALDADGATGAVGNFNSLKFTVTGPVQTPFKGAPFVVGASPVIIQAEDFDKGGEAVAFHDLDAANLGGQYRSGESVDIEATTDAGGGYNVGWVRAGEWLEYSIDVATAGAYNFDFRVASTGAGGAFHAEIDGVDVTGKLLVPNTGGWQNWTTVSKSGVNLAAGKHVLRLSMDLLGATGAVGNFNFVKISPAVVMPTTLTTDTAAFVRDGTFADTNFGEDPELLVKDSTPGFKRESYIKFDLSSLSTISSAKLRLFGRLWDTVPFSVNVQVNWSSSTWSESSLTWNNRPRDARPLGTISVSGATGKWYELDLTSFLLAEKAAGHDVVTLRLISLTFTASVCAFAADSTPNAPQLVVTP